MDADGSGKKGKPYHHGDLRSALIAAASAVAARDGVDAIRVSDLAREIGVSGAAPFRHFPTRGALLVAVAEAGAQRMVAALERAAAAQPDPLTAQQARGAAYVRFAVEEPGYFRVLSRAEVLAESELLRTMNAASQAEMEVVLGGRAGVAAPEVARRSAGLLAAQALTYGLARMLVDGLLGEISPADAERLAWEVTDVLGSGLDP